MRPLILIPARLGAARLPGKPLADIAGRPMIAHVFARAREADIGPVYVATDAPEIVAAIEAIGGEAIMTGAYHASGSDRIAEALAMVDPQGRHDIIVNVQGDEPLIEPASIRAATALMADSSIDIGTLGVISHEAADRDNPNIVKIIGAAARSEFGPDRLRALYFTRAPAPWGDGPVVRHVGLYAWRRAALLSFISLPRSPLESRENLEQLRALEAGMRIDAALLASCPHGVDTKEDLLRVNKIVEGRLKSP